MAFDLEPTNIYPPSQGPERPGGFMSVVEWIDDDKLAARSISGSKSQHLNREVALSEFVLDATKDTTDSPTWVDNFTYTALLRRHFSAGEVAAIPQSGEISAVSAYQVALSIAQDEFDHAAESQITRALIAATSWTDITPGTTPSFRKCLGMLERAGIAAVGGFFAPFVMFPVTASGYGSEINLGLNISPVGYTDGGSRLIFSPGATTDAELAALDTAPTAITGYCFGQPYGTKAMTVTSSRLGDDFDPEINDIYVTVEAIYNIGFNGADQFSCDFTP